MCAAAAADDAHATFSGWLSRQTQVEQSRACGEKGEQSGMCACVAGADAPACSLRTAIHAAPLCNSSCSGSSRSVTEMAAKEAGPKTRVQRCRLSRHTVQLRWVEGAPCAACSPAAGRRHSSWPSSCPCGSHLQAVQALASCVSLAVFMQRQQPDRQASASPPMFSP